MTKSAGLSRAYAVLRQLELLRLQDVLDPLSMDTDMEPSSNTVVSSEEEGSRSPNAYGGAVANSFFSSHCVEREGGGMRSTGSPTLQPCRELRGKTDDDEKSRFVASCGSTAAGSVRTAIASPFSGSAEGKNKALQRILQEIVARRSQASKLTGMTSDTSGDKGGHHLCHRQRESVDDTKSSSCCGVQRVPSGLCRGDGEVEEGVGDDVFFDNPLLFSHATSACSTRVAGDDMTPAKGEGTHQNSGDTTDNSVLKSRRSIHTEHGDEWQGENNPQNTRKISQRKTRDTITSPVVSKYAKSLLRHYGQRQERRQREIQQRMEERPHTSAESPGHVEPMMVKQPPSPSSVASAVISPIQRIVYDGTIVNNDDDDDEFNLVCPPSPTRGLGLDMDTSRTASTAFSRRSLMPFLHELTVMGSDELQGELREMVGCSDGSASHCRDWFALTALVNSHDAVRHIIVPLLISELLEYGDTSEYTSEEANSRMCNILCALIGLGELAEAVLQVLLESLIKSHGPLKLVVLAIRAVGGDSGLRALCRVARDSRADPTIRAAAVYGISALAYPVVGHTTVHCIGAPGLENVLVLYQPPVEMGYLELNADGSPRQETSLQCPPPYRPTHIVLDAEFVRQKLLCFTASKNFRRSRTSYATLPLVMQDFACMAPEAFRSQGLSGVVQEALQYYTCQLNDTLGAPQRVLPFSYDPHYIGCEDKLFAIEETLMTVLLDCHTPPRLVEQTLVSVASLPYFATTHVSSPLLDYLIQSVSRLEQRRDRVEIEGEEAVVATGFVALGHIVCNEGTPPSVTDRACELLLQGLSSSVRRVRHSACIGLGEIGAVSNMSETVTHALTKCLSDSAMNHDTVAWALARLGMCGMRVLLERIAGPKNNEGGGAPSTSTTTSRRTRTMPGHSVSTRVACVRSLVRVDLLKASLGIHENAELMREELVRQLSTAISDASVEEDVVLECVYALAEIVAVRIDNDNGNRSRCIDVVQRNDEAVMYYRTETPNEAFQVLKSLVETLVLPFSVQRALFYSICAYGGAHGELYVSQTAICSPVAASRAAAAFGLRACGGKVIRTLVMALNDDTVEVRLEAFETLDVVGVDNVLAVLRTRPPQHTQQVVAALRDCLLRDMGRKVKRQVAQDLYAALVRDRA